MKNPLSIYALLLAIAPLTLSAHDHLNAGIGSSGNQLRFVNGPTFDTNSLYAVYCALGGSSAPAELYQSSGFTFAALSPNPLNGGGPNNGHAAYGAHLELEVVSVSGPEGGVWSLWFDDFGTTSLLFSEPVGQTNGTNRFALSQNNGEPDADPHGHIHGRIYGMTKPGLYTLGFRIIDTSSIHTPSDIYYFHFQAGLTISRLSQDETSSHVLFGTQPGAAYYLESTPGLGGTNVWTEVAGPLFGNSRLQTMTAESSTPQQFFRIRVEEP